MVAQLDKQARLDGRDPLTSRSYDWSADNFPFSIKELDKLGNNAVKLSYNKIKSLTTVTPATEPNTPEIVTPGEFSDALED